MGADEGREQPQLTDPGEIGGWKSSASAWIEGQGEEGDLSRRLILDPLLDRLLADVIGQTILDVGCGEGRYARKLSERGASVTGIDPVEQFIERARRMDPKGRYFVGQGESLSFDSDRFDQVLSYLSLVDIADHRKASFEMARVLKPGGTLTLVTISNLASTTDGWVKGPEGEHLYRTVDRYMEEFSMTLEWAGLRIINYHRPLSALLQPFFVAGLVMDGFHEPLPDPSTEWFEQESRVPTFQVYTFKK